MNPGASAMGIKRVQFELAARGFDPGPIDGIWGRRSIAALREFQKSQKMPSDGILGPVVLQALAPRESGKSLDPVWLLEARRHMGLAEIAGARSNATILSWARRIGGWVAQFYRDDEIPWCGLAMAHWIGATLPDEPLPANPLSAGAWANFGRPLQIPAPGAIMIYRRKGGHHVNLYVGENEHAIFGVGGNQSNRVSIVPIARERLMAMRWPATVPLPVGERVFFHDTQALSVDES